MAAHRSLAACLLLWLIVSGCGTLPLRGIATQREPDAAQAASPSADQSRFAPVSPEEPDDDIAQQDTAPASRDELGGSNRFSGHSQLADRTPLAAGERVADRDVVPEAIPLHPTPAPRGAALTGGIDPLGEIPITAEEQLAGHDVSAEGEPSAVDLAVQEAPPAELAPADAESDGSPWGLPRIPDVLSITRRTEDAQNNDWSWGLSQRLLPGSRTNEPQSQDVPVRTTALPETLPESAVIWGEASAYSQEELSKLITLIEAELTGVTPTTESQRRDYLRRHVLLRHLYLLAGRPHDAQRVIPGIDAADQEFWSEMYWAMSSYFDDEMLPSRGDRAAQTVARLASAERALASQVPLEIRNLQFCRQISSFGNYETYGIDEFSPGQPLSLYAEIRQFASEADPSGVYRTLLESEIEIYAEGASRELIDRTVFPVTEDLCRTRRQDYFHSYRIELPSNLAPGPYVLQLTVQDRLGQKSATQTRRFLVMPGPRLGQSSPGLE